MGAVGLGGEDIILARFGVVVLGGDVLYLYVVTTVVLVVALSRWHTGTLVWRLYFWREADVTMLRQYHLKLKLINLRYCKTQHKKSNSIHKILILSMKRPIQQLASMT